MKEYKTATRVLIPCRLSYAYVWEPRRNDDENSSPKYSTVLLIDKKDKKTLDKIEKAIEAAKIAGKTKLANAKGVIPKNIKTPLRDADEEECDNEEYKGMMFINANSYNKPQIVDRHLNKIIDTNEVYSGCYANVTVNFYAFDVGTNKGIAAGLGNIQKVKDGERLSGGASAEDDFEALDEDEDDIF